MQDLGKRRRTTRGSMRRREEDRSHHPTSVPQYRRSTSFSHLDPLEKHHTKNFIGDHLLLIAMHCLLILVFFTILKNRCAGSDHCSGACEPFPVEDTLCRDVPLSPEPGPDEWTLLESMDRLQFYRLLDRGLYLPAGLCDDDCIEAVCDLGRREERAPTEPVPGRRLGLSLLLYQLDPWHGKFLRSLYPPLIIETISQARREPGSKPGSSSCSFLQPTPPPPSSICDNFSLQTDSHDGDRRVLS